MDVINLIEDIIDLVRYDNRHTVKILIEPVWLIVYLSDDPDNEYEERYVRLGGKTTFYSFLQP